MSRARRSPTPCAARLKRRRDLISPARRYAESTILSDDGTRYIVLFFRTDRFGGELKSSDEGRVFWVERDELTQYKLSHDFIDMVHVMENPSLTEFFYERDGEIWKKRII